MCKFIKLSVILVLGAFVLFGCKDDSSKTIFHSTEDVSEATIALSTGTTHDQWVRDNLPEADVIRFDTQPDVYLALKGGKSDLAIVDGISHHLEHGKDATIGVLVERLFEEKYGVGFNKGETKLLSQYNQFLKKIRANGLYDQICRRWEDSLSTAKMPDLSSVSRSGDPIKVGCSGCMDMYDFIRDGKNAGLDIEFMERFAAEVGRPIEYQVINFAGLISAVSSGVVDVITSSICITPERSKTVAFGDTYYSGFASVIARAENLPKGFSSMKDVEDKKIGVLQGSSQEEFARKTYPNANILRINNNSDLLLALQSGQCDVALFSHMEAKLMMKENQELAVLQDGLTKNPVGMCFRKGDAELKDKFNLFLKDLKASGQMQEIGLRWLDGMTDAVSPKLDVPKGGKPLVIATTLLAPPFSFSGADGPEGLDIELMRRFAISIGRKPVFETMNFESLIPFLMAGKADVIANEVMITEERAQKVDFSDPYVDITTTAIVKKSKLAKSSDAYTVIADGDGSDLNSADVGIMTGSFGEMLLMEQYPGAKLSRFDDITDAVTALATRKVRYVMTAYTTALAAARNNKNMVLLPKHYTEEGAGVAVNKGNTELLEKINAAIAQMKKDGTMDQMINRWINSPDGEYPEVDVPQVKEGKTLKVGVSANREPMCFIHNGKYAGLDAEMMQRVAYLMGMKIQFSDMKFAALTAALTSGKVDAVASNFTETAERKKSVDFTDVYFTNPQILMVSATVYGGESDHKNVFVRVKESFYNNLILERRYMLILSGLWRTVLISVFALLLGTILGAGICGMKMSKNIALRGFAKGYIDVMRGTPVLVLLMIVFYVVFAKSDISATTVAIITFALNFAAYVSEMFRTSIEGIDRGQREAGIALGFTNTQTFRFIIMPQAIKRVLPVYKGEAISLIKMTSVVGYIAVQDLTKASDIIRSRTFDAFFPLIVITIIYFLLAWIFGLALDQLNKKTDRK